MTVFRLTDASIILSVTRTAGNGIFTGAVRRRIFVFRRAITRLLTGHSGDGMNHAGRKLRRRASSIKIVMFHTIRIVFDNISAAVVSRTAGRTTALPVWQPPGCGK